MAYKCCNFMLQAIRRWPPILVSVDLVRAFEGFQLTNTASLRREWRPSRVEAASPQSCSSRAGCLLQRLRHFNHVNLCGGQELKVLCHSVTEFVIDEMHYDDICVYICSLHSLQCTRIYTYLLSCIYVYIYKCIESLYIAWDVDMPLSYVQQVFLLLVLINRYGQTVVYRYVCPQM